MEAISLSSNNGDENFANEQTAQASHPILSNDGPDLGHEFGKVRLSCAQNNQKFSGGAVASDD
jgi:hypothetical protein